MASTFSGLYIGRSGLYTYSAALTTTAHNITNSGTTGYSRQIVNQQASKAQSTGTSWGMVGTGVTVTSISQVRSQYLDEKYRYNSTLLGEYSTKSYYVSEIESALNEVSVDGFNTAYNAFYDALQSLSTDASSSSVRQQVNTTAETFTEYLNSLATDLENVQKDCNTEVKSIVDRINSIAQQLTVLTKQINTVEATGVTANDLRDQRNVLIDELSTYCSVDVEETAVGDSGYVTEYRVKINGQLLVDTNTYNELAAVARDEKVNQTDVDGLYDVVWAKTGDSFNVSGTEAGGSLAAVIAVRDGNNSENLQGTATGTAGSSTITITDTNINSVDTLNINSTGYITVNGVDYKYEGFSVSTDSDGNYVYTFDLGDETLSTDISNGTASVGDSVDYKGIPYYMSQLNELVRTYASSYNEIVKSGIDANGDAGVDYFTATDSQGNEMTWTTEATDGVLFTSNTGIYSSSTTYSYYQMTASNITVNSEVLSDTNKVVTRPAGTVDEDGNVTDVGVEDASIVEELIALKSDTTMFKQGTPGSFFETLVAEVGVESEKVSDLSTNQEDILSTVDNQRLSVSGVDLDEEAMNLIMYQQAYNLSAKIISVMNEIYDRLINYTGV